jgi:S-adenosylmethionine-diacylglycerol 3-amino-3-carboxypropyl transferase
VDRYNLSDIFEYMSPEAAAASLSTLAEAGRGGGRLAYWNMLAPRSRPEALVARLRPRPDVSQPLHEMDKAFFYSAFVVEEVA